MKILDASRCWLDVLSLGEVMIRLSPPGHGRLEFATHLELWVGGGEYNVAYSCSRLGLRAGFVSRMVDNPLGWLVRNHARAGGVDVSELLWVDYDGIGRTDRMGLNFTEVGTGLRASVTVYDRGHSAASHMHPGQIDWDRIFSRGVRWFHTGGIFTALSPGCAKLCAEALAAAKRAGAITSYDLNFRSKLWNSQTARETTRPMLKHIDVLIGNEEDFQKALGYEVPGIGPQLRQLDATAYTQMVERLIADHPHLQAVGTTLREVRSGLLNDWSAILYHRGSFFQSRKYENLEIEDRVGGGDGFSSGLVYGFLNGLGPQRTVDFAAALGALVQSTRGDCSQVTLAEVEHLLAGGTARIKR